MAVAVEVGSPVLEKTIDHPTLSLIVPAFNEEQHIAESLGRLLGVLRSIGLDFEVVVVDDGSTDRTSEETASVTSNSHVRVVGYPLNQGKGWAARYGMKHARGDIAVFLDGDGEISPENLWHYVKALEDADIVIASKRHRASRVSTPILRSFLSYGFNVLVQLLTGIRNSDTQTGLKAIRVDAFRRILPLLSVKRFAYDVEFLTVASLLRMRVVELPVSIRLGALFSARQIMRILIDLLGITYRLRVIRWYQGNLHNPKAVYKPIIRW